MFLVLSIRGSQKILCRRADPAGGKTGGDFKIATFKKFEKTLGMLFFLVGRLFKNIGNLYKPLIFCSGSKISVTIACLAFTGK